MKPTLHIYTHSMNPAGQGVIMTTSANRTLGMRFCSNDEGEIWDSLVKIQDGRYARLVIQELMILNIILNVNHVGREKYEFVEDYSWLNPVENVVVLLRYLVDQVHIKIIVQHVGDINDW